MKLQRETAQREARLLAELDRQRTSSSDGRGAGPARPQLPGATRQGDEPASHRTDGQSTREKDG